MHTHTQAHPLPNFLIHFPSSSSSFMLAARICVVSTYGLCKARDRAGVAERLCFFPSYFWAQVDTDSQSNTSVLPRRSCHSGAQMFQLWQEQTCMGVCLCLYVHILACICALRSQALHINIAEKLQVQGSKINVTVSEHTASQIHLSCT